MQDKLLEIKKNIKPKNGFWKFVGKAAIFILSIVIKNQKNVDPADVDKGADILNKSLE
ncbi:hypothetical protein [Flavobacterium sp.]|uniref:hypothetical protein n=1 Tax=Flavobacterium sp. TaxID=239 RepID=UPI003750EFBA